MTTTAPSQGSTATAQEESDYQYIVGLMSGAIGEGVANVLKKMNSAEGFAQTVSESAQSNGAEVDLADLQAKLKTFWKYATGFDANVKWHNVTGNPERSGQVVSTVPRPEFASEEASPEWGLSLGAFGINVGFHT